MVNSQSLLARSNAERNVNALFDVTLGWPARHCSVSYPAAEISDGLGLSRVWFARPLNPRLSAGAVLGRRTGPLKNIHRSNFGILFDPHACLSNATAW